VYTLDGLGNPTTTTVNAEFNPTFDTLTYQYDGLNRLQHFNAAYGPTGTLDYTYDTANNRQTLNQNGVVTVYSYDGADRLLTINDQATGADNDGNLQNRPGFSYQYDQADRLTQVTVGSGSNTCTGHSIYDADGRRISRTNTGSCLANGHTYVDDVSGSLPQLIEDGSLYYIRGMGLAYTVDLTNSVASVFHTDSRGSVRAITDQNGVLAQSYQYDPSGIQTGSGTSQQVLGFTGEPQDPDNGLVYLRARSYDPAIGRFLERDTMLPDPTNPDSFNRFTYASNNPSSHTDHTGHCVDPDPFGIGPRYCIESFIPTLYSGLFPGNTPWNGPFSGDFRGPSPFGGSFRIQQLITASGVYLPTYGPSQCCFGLAHSGMAPLDFIVPACNAYMAGELGFRTISTYCSGVNGLLPIAPPIVSNITINEDNGVAPVPYAYGTPYPSTEVWQYGGPSGDPSLIFYHEASPFGPGALFFPGPLDPSPWSPDDGN